MSVPATGMPGESSRDDSLTRPVPPTAAQAAASTQPPTIPPVPPLDAVTAPVMPQGGYQPPSLPRTSPRQQRAAPGSASAPPAYPRRAGGPYESQENTAALPPALSPDFGQAEVVERSARAWRLVWFSAVALVVVLLLGAGGAVLLSNGQLAGIFGGQPGGVVIGPTSTSSGGPPAPPAGFVRYTAANYTIVYPRTWAETPQATGDGVEFHDPVANAHFNMQTFATGSDSAGLDDQFIIKLGAALASASGGAPTISNKTAPTNATMAAATWAQESADISVPGASGGPSITWHVVALATTYNQTTYVIGYFAPQAVFSAQDTAAFQPMLAGLQLVSAHP